MGDQGNQQNLESFSLERLQGDKCSHGLVAWGWVKTPIDLGGPEIPD